MPRLGTPLRSCALFALVAIAAPAAPPCGLKPTAGQECWGLVQNVSATTPGLCEAACCAAGPASCAVWNFCPTGAACVTPGTCWLGLSTGGCRASAGWVGAGAALVPSFDIDVSALPAPVVPIPPMGANTNPRGDVLTFDSVSWLVNGVRTIPVGGEIQFSRQPDVSLWRSDLLAMKAGGLNTIGTYVFWIYHEEELGVWRWDAERNLTHFLTIAGEIGLNVILRLGPWAHGECRNGGFPDHVQHDASCTPRNTSPCFLAKAAELYAQIAQQCKGLLWKDGGPVIAVQIDNEWGGSYTYLEALKNASIAAGIDVPAYTKTGWPSEDEPFGMLLPFNGGYADGFWDSVLVPVPSYLSVFSFSQMSMAPYPALSIELGGGMTVSYHRRIEMHPDDMGALALVALGSGSQQLGFYIGKGATHDIGKLSSLQESQASGYPNDLALKSYDFYAPLGEYGETHGHYHLMRRTFLTAALLGSWLAPMPPFLPATRNAGPDDYSTLRWSVRSDGQAGLAFVNMFQRNTPGMQSVPNVRLNITLKGGSTVQVPALSSPAFTFPAGRYTAIPFNLPIGDLVVAYALAQPLATVSVPSDSSLTLFLAATDGLATEIAVVAAAGIAFASCGAATCTAEGSNLVVRAITLGTAVAAAFSTPGGMTVRMVLLSEEQALSAYTGMLAGSARVFLSERGPVLLDPQVSGGAAVRLRVSNGRTEASVAVYPAPASLSLAVGGAALPVASDGVFGRFTIPASALPQSPLVVVSVVQVQQAGPPRVVPLGPHGVAQAPDQDGTMTNFTTAAAIWNVTISLPLGPLPPAAFPRLNIRYQGDCLRVLFDGEILGDNFNNQDSYRFGIARYFNTGKFAGASVTLQLYILPLTRVEPIYFSSGWPDFKGQDALLSLDGVDVEQDFDVDLVASAT